MHGSLTSFLLPLVLVLAWCGGHVDCGLAARDKRSDDMPALATVVSGLSQQVTQLSAQLTALQTQHDQLQAKFDASQKQVSFSAYNTADPFNVAASGTLVYNHADINQGGGFDPVTGVFTAPAPGLYVFFISCMGVSNGYDQDIGVQVDGTRVSGCYTNSHDGNSELGSGLATVHMNAGQRAWVHLYRTTGRDVRGGYWNTFAGFLVKSDS